MKYIGIILFTLIIVFSCNNKSSKKMEEFVEAVKKGNIVLKNEKTFFPWEDVLNCKDDIIKPPDKYKSYKYPYCGEKEVIWIYFRSSDWTWEQLCGKIGPLSICPKCARQVEFICHIMN
ncbi:MAG: hypothetical protein LBP67_10220 [Bacteroidales bacterium]|jgi:hypothetical protein|nr:hypothetical protein [Bacteroidales bacterium]